MVTCAAADCCVLAPVTQAEWAWGVWFAHRLFGILALYLMVVWSVLLLELTTLERAFCASGGATVACGIWLVLWVLLLLKTSVPTHELWDFAMADLAQMQHLAMGVLFVAAGSAELYFAAAVYLTPHRLRRTDPHRTSDTARPLRPRALTSLTRAPCICGCCRRDPAPGLCTRGRCTRST